MCFLCHIIIYYWITELIEMAQSLVLRLAMAVVVADESVVPS